MNNTTNEENTCSEAIFPIANESSWPLPLRVTLYLMGLCYMFYGVQMASDVFMNAIEKITSKVKIITLPYPESETGLLEVKIKVWNPAVANLSLLALGTSAPEILLACVEIILAKFEAGVLGPGTIVGSAAFNLFVITGICVSYIPKGETKRIVRYKVFWVTVVTGIGAYAWMAFIVKVWTPGVVTIPEALITFLSFPTLILVAYFADKNFLMENCLPRRRLTVEQQLKDMAPHMRVKQLANIVERNERPYAWRKHTMGGLGGDKSRRHSNANRLFGKLVRAPSNTISGLMLNKQQATQNQQANTYSYFSFIKESVCVAENLGVFSLHIQRSGNMAGVADVHVKTFDGTAKTGEDYIPVDTIIHFEEGESTRCVEVEIVDDDLVEGREYFHVYMVSIKQTNCLVGKISECKVYIIDDDSPGSVTFAYTTYLFKQSDGAAVLPVFRLGGTKGECTIAWTATSGSAIEGVHYAGGSGELSFANKEECREIVIPFVEDADEIDINQEVVFSVQLSDPRHSNKVGEICETSVNIVNDEAFNQILDEATSSGESSEGVGESGYPEAFTDAVSLDWEEATGMDYFFYVFGLLWRLLVACIPPTKYCGGWLAFVFSLLFIGCITGVIENMTKVLACYMEVKNNIAAITLVALGTSVPDTFASMMAAKQEPTADDSIGNILGSNSVNVFLGLGLPWLVASIYWNYQGKDFKVKTDGVIFSVTLYTILAVITILLLTIRRNSPAIKGELGGPIFIKYITTAVMFILWIVFILISILASEDIISKKLFDF